MTGPAESPSAIAYDLRTWAEKVKQPLHDGRARTLDEAIRWHGGEGEAARDAYVGASEANRAALVRFLGTL